ncbi:DEAD/DEAH box helicase family protein [Fuchsiella alkaliacetigena]|uniref:DEAD/DEAH box helicase family protein n=1 Tax=Fuchsiella alkaliacetigena TaxID=957042 RepID=UPI002009F35A|nr:DEAD/DEAH box helicase family protein [Fuchsiella alkaliacetigena]MCK8825786.1 DEAD/DEAH box helicase family protein [Fuchsiella alkaliacetigena]
MNINIRAGDYEEGVERVIMNIKNEIKNNDNASSINIEYKMFLDSFGYKRGSEKLFNTIDKYLDKYNIDVSITGSNKDEINWNNIETSDWISFSLNEESTSQILNDKIDIDYAGNIKVKKGDNPFDLYLHQKEAINLLNEKLEEQGSFSGILAIPTGGGKTLTAIQWLLRNIIDKNKKVLWIAHRHELLNQAFNALEKNSFSSLLRKRKKYRYRIISGQHDKSVNIQADDDFIIASKDSLYRNMNYLIDNWVKDLNEVVLVIDEAHHATAKTYRKIIDGLKNNVNKFNMLGLTATPFRTSDTETGLLKKLFKDDIIYKIDLETLINRGILSAPSFKETSTDIKMHKEFTDEDIEKIKFSELKGDIAKKIVENSKRNNFIVEHYLNNKDKYEKTLVFAIDIEHAITLNKLFNKRGIASEYIVSSVRDAVHGVSISSKDNKEKVQKFREDKIDVLINIEILTEGVDLPEVKTVFLTRPTISTILMTQMIGRGLRGEKAGGTEESYIVSFIDEWKDKINWVNPERLYLGNADFDDDESEYRKKLVRLVSIEKIEEFASVVDDTVDTTELESLDFLSRIPIGLYSFSLLITDNNGEEAEKNCEVLVYDDMYDSYKEFINELEKLFNLNNLNDKEKLSTDELESLCNEVERKFFIGKDFTLDYKRENIKDILRYYAFKGAEPPFLEFKDREKFDLSREAKYIFENSLGGREKREYMDKLWEEEDKSWWQILFNHNKRYFIEQLNKEIQKLEYPELMKKKNKKTEIEYDSVELKKLSMSELREKAPKYWRNLHNAVYEKAKDEEGYYNSAISDFRSKSKIPFQIDHIIPISKGGETTLDNLQLLTKRENAKKSNKV